MRTGLKEKMVTRERFKTKVDIVYYSDSTKITNSYLLTKSEIERVAETIDYSRQYMYSWKCKYLRNTRSYILEITGNKKSTITGNESSTTYYPTTKAVADYVSGIVGDINTILDEINGEEI